MVAVTHGKRSVYNSGCRCADCTEANTEHTRAWAVAHREENRARDRRYRQAGGERVRELARRRVRRQHYKRYGTTLEAMETLWLAQDELCALCRREIPQTKNRHVDHCHTTGKIRGILCVNCNLGLGNFGDNIDFLERAIAYLRKHKE